jgi:hypothetical protein
VLTELGNALRDALQGKLGADAIVALFTALQSYIIIIAFTNFQKESLT